MSSVEDIAYGPDERHRLDVFAPAARPGRAMPVVLFVPGGGFVGGAKSREGVPFYQNVGVFFAKNGVVGVTMNYRLAPKHMWPAGGEDVAAALRWIRKNIAEFGGDPERIFLFGQSAGGTHAAHYVFDERLQPPAATTASRARSCNPRCSIPRAGWRPNVEAYFGPRAGWAEKSLLTKLEGRKIPRVPGLRGTRPEAVPRPGRADRRRLEKRDGAPAARARPAGAQPHQRDRAPGSADDSASARRCSSSCARFSRGAQPTT